MLLVKFLKMMKNLQYIKKNTKLNKKIDKKKNFIK